MESEYGHTIFGMRLKRPVSRPPPSQTNSHAALITQIQTGIKLKKSPLGQKIWDESTSKEEVNATNNNSHLLNSLGAASCSYATIESIETSSNLSSGSSSSGVHSNISQDSSSTGSASPTSYTFPRAVSPKVKKKELPPPTLEKTMPAPRASNQRNEYKLDVTQMPGYQDVPEGCPMWKQAMIEKKNQQILEDAMRELADKKAEEDRWRDVPEWKKSLILDKEKRKTDDLAPLELEKRKRDDELTRIHSMPAWKRDLLLKKRPDT